MTLGPAIAVTAFIDWVERRRSGDAIASVARCRDSQRLLKAGRCKCEVCLLSTCRGEQRWRTSARCRCPHKGCRPRAHRLLHYPPDPKSRLSSEVCYQAFLDGPPSRRPTCPGCRPVQATRVLTIPLQAMTYSSGISAGFLTPLDSL